MKFIFLLLLPVFSLAQIEVKKTPTKFTVGKVTTAELYGLVVDSDTTYVLQYKNGQYSTITDYQSVSFKDDGGTLEDLYKTFSSFFLDENKKNKEYKVSFKLGETEVVASNYISMGFQYIIFSTPNGYGSFSEKQLKKLFGKN